MRFLCQIPRSVIRIGGDDRAVFLQGLVSNDVARVPPGQAIFAALLTPQGKFLHDLFIVEQERFFLIDCEAARAEDLLKRFAAHKLRAKITLENVREEFDVWAAWGEGNLESENKSYDEILVADPRLKELGARIITKKNAAPEGILASFEEYDGHRLALGIPDGSRDMIVEKSTLAEGNFDLLNGISWTKGCYMGQELTARMHYRALVKKRIFPVTIEGGAPTLGSIISLNDEEIGEMRSSCGNLGLALFNIEKAQEAAHANKALVCEKSTLKVQKPKWMEV